MIPPIHFIPDAPGGMDFDAALRAAQIQGFAEAVPMLDVGGGDAAGKLPSILASLAAGGFF